MIYTLTVNPALDIKIIENELSISSGGKGINVSRVLLSQGKESIVLGFLGGETGKRIEDLLDKRIKKDFVYIKEDNRRNIKLNEDGIEKEFNGPAPFISDEEKLELIDKVSKLDKGDFLVLSGSVPKSLGNTFYEEIIKNIKCPFVVDTTKDNLLNTLKYGPELIKPNNFELEDLFNESINDLDDVKRLALKLIDLGAKRVIVSLGSKGSYFISKNNELYTPPLEGKILSTTGAGDSMVAGFIKEYLDSKDEIRAYKAATDMANEVCFKGLLL